MPDSERTFHLFPRLPVELQLAIWRECLPHRVHELDNQLDEIIFSFALPPYDPLKPRPAMPCNLQVTSWMNGLPPLIARVCRTSRAVALETGKFPEYNENQPKDAYWVSGTTVGSSWLDTSRDSVHLNWTPTYEADYSWSGEALGCLAWEATNAAHGGSFMFDYLLGHVRQPSVPKRIEFFNRLPSWKVVMRVVVVHTDPRTAARTGLFGLLGDARVQLVDIFDKAKVNSFFDLAAECESKGDGVAPKQNFLRVSPELVEKELRNTIVDTFESTKLLPPMYPVFMFRLCTEMCNYSAESQEKFPHLHERYEEERERKRKWGRE